MTLQELATVLTPEQKSQVKICVTAKDVLELARRENLPFTRETAEEILEMYRSPVGELSDSELEAVSGGAGGNRRNSCYYGDPHGPKCGIGYDCEGCRVGLFTPQTCSWSGTCRFQHECYRCTERDW